MKAVVIAACLVSAGVALMLWRRRRVPRGLAALVVIALAAAALLGQSHPAFAVDACAAASPSTPSLPIIPVTPVAPSQASESPVPSAPVVASEAPVPSIADQASDPPAPVVPEAPAVLLLGVSTAVVLGGYAVLRRRRMATSA